MTNLEEFLTPRKIVEELDKYIIGQEEAKRCVAVALRNRYRRKKLVGEIKEEIFPKNIIMIGPTGVGKTEIARRLARLVNSPFIKVEATKFTEVGYVGRDVDSIIRDLVESSVRIVKEEKMADVEKKAAYFAEDRLLELLVPRPEKPKKTGSTPFDFLFQASGESHDTADTEFEDYQEKVRDAEEKRKIMQEKLKRSELEEELVEVEVNEQSHSMMEAFSGLGMEEMGVNMQELLGNMLPKKKKKKKVPVKQARKILQQEEAEKLIDMDEVNAEAVERAEQYGMIFLDEIDKIAGKESSSGNPDVSREGVQRDILPIIEGATVMTKYGPVRTDFMLFIAAGAFNFTKPSDLIPELQGRFPIRVELKSLTEEDFRRILTQPENALIKQYSSLLETEGVSIEYSDDGIYEIASTARLLNEEMEDIGARRLHTIMEKIFEEISFEAPELTGEKVTINKEYVESKLKNIVKNRDLSRYIL